MMSHEKLYWELYRAALIALESFDGDIKDLSWFPNATRECKILRSSKEEKFAQLGKAA